MTTKAQQKRNCRYLAKKLQTIPKEHYYQNSYYCHSGGHVQDKPEPFDCKTTACAWGHAACMPYFNKQGLFLNWGDGYWWPDFGYDANKGLALFGMTKYEAAAVFGSNPEASTLHDPQAVADKLLAHAKTL